MAIGLAGILAGIGSLLGEELLKSGAKETVKIPFDAVKGPKGPTQMQLVGANGQPMDYNQGGPALPMAPPQPPQPQQQGLGQMMAPEQPGYGTKLRRGLGDALMGIGAIGLGGDPFQVMQGQRQARADSEQREIENKRAEQDFGMRERQFGLQERQVAAQEADAADKKADRERARKVGLSIAASIDPKLTMAAAQAYPVVDAIMGGEQQPGLSGAMGAQPPQRGLGGIMARPQGLDPNITDQEWQLMAPLIQEGDYEALGKKYEEYLLSPASKPGDLDNLVIMGPDGQPMINELALEAKRKLAEAGSNKTTINNTPLDAAAIQAIRGEKEAEKAGGVQAESNNKAYDTFIAAGDAAQSRLATLSAIESMIDAGAFQGPGAEAKAWLVKAAATAGIDLGVDPVRASATEVANSLGKKLISDTLGSLGTGISNADREFYELLSTRVTNTEAGNRALIAIHRELADHAARARDYADEITRANGGYPPTDFRQQMGAWAKANPAFTPEEQKILQGKLTGGGGGKNFIYNENGELVPE